MGVVGIEKRMALVIPTEQYFSYFAGVIEREALKSLRSKLRGTLLFTALSREV